jgi:hypothetical protein
MQAEVRRLTRQLYLNRLLSVLVSDQSSATVKGLILLEIKQLENDLKKGLTSNIDINEKASFTWMLDVIERYRQRPSEFKPVSSPTIPPGQPIGCGEE